jgi:hypothetical protein
LWLRDKSRDDIIIKYSHSYSIGSGISKGKKNPFYDLTESKLVLRKDLSQELGFRIITAFPVIK